MKPGDDVFAALSLRDGPICYIDGLEGTEDDPLEIEHFHPRSLGGGDDFANLRLAHRSCNRIKGVNAVVPKADA